MGQSPHIIKLSQVYKLEEDLIGKKAHGLGILWKLGIPLPEGFVITTEFFKECLRQTRTTHIPHPLAAHLHEFYRNLSGIFKNRSLNIFSSSLSNKSITFSNIKGDANLIHKIKQIWSMSLEKPVAIVVQENIESKVMGKMSTNNPIHDNRLTDLQMNQLTDYCKKIQKHFYFPKEIEYFINKKEIFITKVIPFTPHPTSYPSKPSNHNVMGAGFTGAVSESIKKPLEVKTKKPFTKGDSFVRGIVTGPVKVLLNSNSTAFVKNGEIAVLPDLNPFTFKKIKNAKAVITDSFFSRPADKVLYRKAFKIPTIISIKNATKLFKNGNVVTVNGSTGEIYSGGLIY